MLLYSIQQKLLSRYKEKASQESTATKEVVKHDKQVVDQISRQFMSFVFSVVASYKTVDYLVRPDEDAMHLFIYQLVAYMVVDTCGIAWAFVNGKMISRDATMIIHHIIFGVITLWFISFPELKIFTSDIVVPLLAAEASTIFLNSRWMAIHIFKLSEKNVLVKGLSIAFVLCFVIVRIVGYFALLVSLVVQAKTHYSSMDKMTYIVTTCVIGSGWILNLYWLSLVFKAMQNAKPSSKKVS